MKKTRLTNEMRNAFVRRVMADVPTVDYETKIRDAVNKAAHAALPKAVAKLLDDPEAADYIKLCADYVDVCEHQSLTFADIPAKSDNDLARIAEAAAAPFGKLWDEQQRQYDALVSRLRAVANHCTTVNALRDALPEFARYLPQDDANAITDLPMVANLVSDLIKAGWPKGDAGTVTG